MKSFTILLSSILATLCPTNYASCCPASHPDLLVFKRMVPLTMTETSNIQTMVATLNEAGTYLSWDGANSASSEDNIKSLIKTGKYHVLLALNPDLSNPIWSKSTQVAVANALNTCLIERLIVWDRFANNIVNIPDLDTFFTQTGISEMCPITADMPPSTGPVPQVGCWKGNFASNGIADLAAFSSIHPETKAYYVDATGPSIRPTLMQYCFGGGAIMYGTTPMDFYLAHEQNPKALAYHINTMDLLMNSDMCVRCPTARPTNIPTASSDEPPETTDLSSDEFTTTDLSSDESDAFFGSKLDLEFGVSFSLFIMLISGLCLICLIILVVIFKRNDEMISIVFADDQT